MQVTLNPTQATILSALVAQGQYPSLETALNAALLHLVDEIHIPEVLDNPSYTEWIEQTRKQIHVAREQIARGEVQPLDEVLGNLRLRIVSGYRNLNQVFEKP